MASIYIFLYYTTTITDDNSFELNFGRDCTNKCAELHQLQGRATLPLSKGMIVLTLSSKRRLQLSSE